MNHKNSVSFLPTEPIGSIPRPPELIAKFEQFLHGTLSQPELAFAEAAAVDLTIAQFEATGSPTITDGRLRSLPQLTEGPFRYSQCAADHLKYALTKTSLPVKQTVFSPSALSMIYPPQGVPGYPRDEFLSDLVSEVERDIRQCLEACADSVQMDCTDTSPKLLEEFIEINNRVLDRFSAEDRKKIGIHSYPGALPDLFRLNAGRFYLPLSNEKNRPRVLASIRANLKPNQFIFIGVVDPTNPHIETPKKVRELILEAARYIPLDRLGTTDDCGFSGDRSTSRETAFAKIKARVQGTALAREALRPRFVNLPVFNQSTQAAEPKFRPLRSQTHPAFC